MSGAGFSKHRTSGVCRFLPILSVSGMTGVEKSVLIGALGIFYLEPRLAGDFYPAIAKQSF
jgi:hypothetical protein